MMKLKNGDKGINTLNIDLKKLFQEQRDAHSDPEKLMQTLAEPRYGD